MPKFSFDPEDIRYGFGLTKLVRPMTGDYVLKFVGDTLIVISNDRRRYCRTNIRAKSTDVSSDYVSDEFFLSIDRQTLFDAKLSSLSVSVTEKALNICAEEDKQTRKASIRRRPDNSRRPKVVMKSLPDGGCSVKAGALDDLLHQVACSALVRETKTEEDMRVNQVHFYPEHHCVVANARTYASAAFLDGLSLSLSIISADIPLCRSFADKMSDDVIIGQSDSHLFLSDPITGSYLMMSRVTSQKPPLMLLESDEYPIELDLDREMLVSNLSWAKTAIEGTPRLSVNAVRSDGESGRFEMLANGQEIASMPVKFRKGKELRADFPITILANIVTYTDGDRVLMRYANPKVPTLLEVTSAEQSAVRGRHFVHSMRQH